MARPLAVSLGILTLILYVGAHCPACLNGGLCLPSNDIHDVIRSGHSLRPSVALRCFCPSPWTGVACERRGFVQGVEAQSQYEDVAVGVVGRKARRFLPGAAVFANQLVQRRKRQRNQTESPHEQQIARRTDSHVSLHEDLDVSCATWCISVLALLFLCTSVANVAVERACRWFYPSELQPYSSGDNAKGFEELRPQDRDFRMIRAILEVSKVSLSPVVIKASLMYIVQARARELTRGFGGPPEWAELSMKVLTLADVAFVVITSCQIWFKGSERVHNVRQSLVVLWMHPNWVFLTCMTVVHGAQAVNAVCLVYCACTMTPEDCIVRGGVASKGFWQGRSPPSLSLEHRMCLVFSVHFLLIIKVEMLAFVAHIFGVHRYTSRGEEDEKDIKMHLEKDIARYRLLTKTGNLAPLLTIIALAIREVPAYSKFDSDLRSVCLHVVATVMISYSLFIASLLLLPKGRGIHVDLGEAVVTLASATDYVLHEGGSCPDVAFRVVRRTLLVVANFIAAVLIASVFFLRREEGPTPAVPWPVMWTLFIMMQCLVVHSLCLLHEIVAAPNEDKVEGLFLLRSTLREIEGFMALAPMLGLNFLSAHSRALMVMRTGELPQWVLTAMNAVAQALLLQLVVTLLEATIAGFLFSDTDHRTWAELQAPHKLRAASREIAQAPEPFKMGDGANMSTLRLESGDLMAPEDPSGLYDLVPETAASPSGRATAIEEAKCRLDAEMAGRFPGQPLSPTKAAHSKSVSDSKVGLRYEVQFLATRFLNLFSTFCQLFLLATLYISTQLILIATWTLNSDLPRKTYTSGDWRSSIFPLLPVSAPTTTAVETMVWFLALFFTVKLSSTVLLSLRYLYAGVNRSALNAFQTASMHVDLIPLIVLLCFMAQSRAVSFHGLNSSPPDFVQMHMIVTVAAMTIQCFANVATPVFTGELTQSRSGARIIPAVRLMFLYVEALASVAMYWGILILLIGIVLMTPEDVVLSSGRSGIAWHGKGRPPELQLVAWNMWGLCSMSFLASAIHKVTHHIITRQRYSDEVHGLSEDVWFQMNKAWAVIRVHRAAVLGRQTALGSVVLGSLFIPLEMIVRPVPGEIVPRLVQEEKVSEDALSVLKTLFFVASLTLAAKTVLVFCYGFLQAPRLEEVCRDETDDQPVLERQISRDFRSEPTQLTSTLSSALKLSALGLALCEAIVVVILATMLFSIIHQHMVIFSVGWYLNGSIYMFALYLFTHFAWFLFVLLGIEDHVGFLHRKSDGFLDVVSACPLVLLLFMSCQQRALEVAGRHGVVPEWIQHLIFGCGMILVSEFVVVAFAPTDASRTNQKEASAWQREELHSQEELELFDQQETLHNRNLRVTYLLSRVVLRFSLYSCLGAVIFGLFWMTEEQCLPKSSR